jgi:hypothetical protein
MVLSPHDDVCCGHDGRVLVVEVMANELGTCARVNGRLIKLIAN